MLSALALAGCHPQPRSVSYFEAHTKEAERVVEACRSGGHRGAECDHAQAGLAASQASARQELFKKSFD
ncbi:EexN family lipoprotein [Phenylobacterium sp. RIFCSPHIGHO2_01_FULL_69_31]|uniref:EexN family lipoprotein n=1 Tax=Phenylobacterium sp. RIFCSPHIGHO2_01_FULL_69_31 TaxID=1801944 RepID=UPI00342B1F75